MKEINAVVFDYGFTISSSHYFNIKHKKIDDWHNIIQSLFFDNKELNKKWMIGEISYKDIANDISIITKININEIISTLEKGCKKIKENISVIKFAKSLKKQNIKIALVTINFDIFNKIIIPNHKYNQLFDVIINSSDYGEIDKNKLWPIAFKKLGNNINYQNCLLIEDKTIEIEKFKTNGGSTIQYIDENSIRNNIGKYKITSS